MTDKKLFTISRYGAGQSNYSLLEQEFKLMAKTIKYGPDGTVQEIQEFAWNKYKLDGTQKVRGPKKQVAARMHRKIETNDASEVPIHAEETYTDIHGNEQTRKVVVGWQRNPHDKPVFQGYRTANPATATPYNVSRKAAKAMTKEIEKPKHDAKLDKIAELEKALAQLKAMLNK
jgi:hypothetical protein